MNYSIFKTAWKIGNIWRIKYCLLEKLEQCMIMGWACHAKCTGNDS